MLLTNVLGILLIIIIVSICLLGVVVCHLGYRVKDILKELKLITKILYQSKDAIKPASTEKDNQ